MIDSSPLKMLKPPRRTASLLLQHMVDKLPEDPTGRRNVKIRTHGIQIVCPPEIPPFWQDSGKKSRETGQNRRRR